MFELFENCSNLPIFSMPGVDLPVLNRRDSVAYLFSLSLGTNSGALFKIYIDKAMISRHSASMTLR